MEIVATVLQYAFYAMLAGMVVGVIFLPGILYVGIMNAFEDQREMESRFWIPQGDLKDSGPIDLEDF